MLLFDDGGQPFRERTNVISRQWNLICYFCWCSLGLGSGFRRWFNFAALGWQEVGLMDKMWPALLKDGDTLRPATRPFIKCLVETKTNTRTKCTLLNDPLIRLVPHGGFRDISKEQDCIRFHILEYDGKRQYKLIWHLTFPCYFPKHRCKVEMLLLLFLTTRCRHIPFA